MGRMGIAVIGSGYWGINYVRTFSELPEAPIIVACDQRPQRLFEIGRRFPRVELAGNVDEVLQRTDIDAVVVSTPATTHFELVKLCLEAGKHVLVEKPLTTTVADGETLLALAQGGNPVLMVGHTFIHNAGIQKVKGYIDRGDVDKVYYLYARRTNMGPIRDDVNALWDLAPHDISIFNYLLGTTAEWVSAIGARVLDSALEDVGFITLGYPSGIIAHIHVSWSDPNKVRETVVVGSNERIVFNDLDTLEPVRVYEKGVRTGKAEPSSYGEFRLQMRDGDIISPKIEMSEPLKNQCRHFMDCVTRRSRPLTTARDGLEVVRVMEAVDRSLALKGVPVPVPGEVAVEVPVERIEVSQDTAHVDPERATADSVASHNGHEVEENS